MVSIGILSIGILSIGCRAQGKFAYGLSASGQHAKGLLNQQYSNIWEPFTFHHGNVHKKILTLVIGIGIYAQVISVNMIFSENYKSHAVFLLSMILVMYRDYNIVGVVTAVSIGVNNCLEYDPENYAHILLKQAVYAFHYYVIYLSLMRTFEKSCIA